MGRMPIRLYHTYMRHIKAAGCDSSQDRTSQETCYGPIDITTIPKLINHLPNTHFALVVLPVEYLPLGEQEASSATQLNLRYRDPGV